MSEPISDRMILEFERPIIDLERKISELRGLSTGTVDFSSEIRRLEQKARKPSERLFAHLLGKLDERGIEPREVLHVGSRVTHDIVPARKLGMRTALFAGDKASLQASPEQLKAAESRPDVLLTELGQVAQVVSGE